MTARFLKFISTITVTAMLIAAPASLANAVRSNNEAPEKRFTQITIRASEIKSGGAFKAIQTVLNSARYSATKDNNYRVIVEPGEYDLRSAVHIYSNTTLVLTNVTLKRSSDAVANMIRIGDDTAVDKGGTGYGTNSNIRVEGGTLNGGATSNTMIKITHASDITMVGTDMLNVKNAHIMEVAAVDGLKIKNCSFKDHVLDSNSVGYESIQLDVPKSGHIVGCRSEALSVRNVRVEGCLFTNCPRAIGSHTQILNLPHENIVIKDNTFREMKSVAIQAENWKDVQITGNRIENTPRGIAFYSVLGNGGGGFRASVLAKEGKTESSVPETYQKPYNANVLISNNTIMNYGALKDVYADYEPVGISIRGQYLKTNTKNFSDGSGGYPKGDYYITGVSIINNIISGAGNGIYMDDVRNSSIESNVISCVNSRNATGAVNPITTLGSVLNSISSNTINASPFHGMELAISTIGKIHGNNIYGITLDGIILEAQSKVTGTISDNIITKISRYGINVRPKSSAGTVAGNVIYGCAKGAIQKEKNAAANIGENYYKISKMTSLTLNAKSIDLGEDESFSLTASYAPANAVAKFRWTSADSLIASVSENGVVTGHSKGETDITITSADGTKAVCRVRVMPAPESVKLNETMLTIGLGETFKLDSELSEGSVAHSVTYVSNNPNAVSVDKSGMIKGTGYGTATVVAKTFNGKHACCNVIVRDAPYDIWFDIREFDMGEGETGMLRVILPEGSASNSMVFASSDEKVVSVAQNGEIIAKSKGKAEITATAFNGTVAHCYITVKGEPVEVAFAQSEYQLTAGETAQPEIVFGENTASYALRFQSSDPDICHINRTTGEITAKKAGEVTLTVKTFNHVAATCKVVINES